MFNPKISGIIAGVAFVVSFLVGLFAGSQFLTVLLRAFILAAVFFILASLAYWLVSQFIPELLAHSQDEPDVIDTSGFDSPGSMVDISVDSSNESPELEILGGSGPELGDRSSGGMMNPGQTSPIQGLDQKQQDDYNKGGEGFTPIAPDDLAELTAVPEEDETGTIDDLPDLESMSGFFAQSDEDDDDDGVIGLEDEISSPSAPRPSRAKKTSNSGDFNVQEMASAIQTILKRDEKG